MALWARVWRQRARLSPCSAACTLATRSSVALTSSGNNERRRRWHARGRGEKGEDLDLVFSTRTGGKLEAGNARRAFRLIATEAGLEPGEGVDPARATAQLRIATQ